MGCVVYPARYRRLVFLIYLRMVLFLDVGMVRELEIIQETQQPSNLPIQSAFLDLEIDACLRRDEETILESKSEHKNVCISPEDGAKTF